MSLEILTNIFERVINNFYKQGVSVRLSDAPDTAYCAGDSIVLPTHLLEEFTAQHLPRFSVLYHELGHALYSHNLTLLLDKWENLPTSHNTYSYHPKYHHLINWIEDFYIEETLIEEYPFLSDVLKCIKRLNVPYDITEIDKAFNYFYVKGVATPTLNAYDACTFKSYINNLLTLRRYNNFGKGPISLLSAKSKETQYVKTIIEFYNWCVSKSILVDAVLPPLLNPNNYISQKGNTTGQTGGQTDAQDDGGGGSSITDHTHLIGQTYIETVPKYDPVEAALVSKDFVAEEKLIKAEILTQSMVDSSCSSLDGLFNSLYVPTSIIQNKVIVPNFFNPNRLLDQVLFKVHDKVFNNVSIYRDISGSTHSHKVFSLINDICKFLNEHIPIDYNFYLYASGDISILQTQFEDWDDYHNETPEIYTNDPLFNQMGGGTNSSAIADVITEQLNDTWLNIVVTDGDLDDLMSRENISTLLDNIFVISLEDWHCIRKLPHYVIVQDITDIPKITNALLNMKGVV